MYVGRPYTDDQRWLHSVVVAFEISELQSTEIKNKMSQSKSNKQTAIDYQLRKTYELIDNAREPVCEGCDRGDKPLSHSHTISRYRCKQIGKPELIYHQGNIELMCFGTSTSCHEIWEGAPMRDKVKLNNFDSMILFIEANDAEKFLSITLAIKSVRTGLKD